MSPLRVLVAEDEAVTSKFVQHCLAKAGYEVVVVTDGRAAARQLESGGFFAALVDWMLPELDGIEVVRKSAQHEKQPFTVLTSVIDIPSARGYALAAGAHDFLAKPFVSTKLLELLRAKHPPEARPVDEGHPLVRAAGWKDLAKILATPVGALLGVTATGEAVAELGPAARFVTCTLTDVNRGCELLLATLAQEADARAVAHSMLGEDVEGSEIGDALAEVLNVVIGVVKSAFVKDGFSFTMGLPSQVTRADVERGRSGAAALASLRVSVPGAAVTMSVAVRATDALAIRVDELREGHVLAEDLRTSAGALLVPACTRITESAARRLRETMKGRSVRVCAPARAAA